MEVRVEPEEYILNGRVEEGNRNTGGRRIEGCFAVAGQGMDYSVTESGSRRSALMGGEVEEGLAGCEDTMEEEWRFETGVNTVGLYRLMVGRARLSAGKLPERTVDGQMRCGCLGHCSPWAGYIGSEQVRIVEGCKTAGVGTLLSCIGRKSPSSSCP